MTALGPRERQRLAALIARLLEPVPDAAHTGIARAMLASKRRWSRDDLGFIRRMVCARSASSADYARLTALVQEARDLPALGLVESARLTFEGHWRGGQA